MENQMFDEVPFLTDLDDQQLMGLWRQCVKFLKPVFADITKNERRSFDPDADRFRGIVNHITRFNVDQLRSLVEMAEVQSDSDICAHQMWALWLTALPAVIDPAAGDTENKYLLDLESRIREDLWEKYPLGYHSSEWDTHKDEVIAAMNFDSSVPAWVESLQEAIAAHGMPRKISSYVVRQTERHNIEITAKRHKFTFTQWYYNKGHFDAFMTPTSVDEVATMVRKCVSSTVNELPEFCEWEHGDGKSSGQEDISSARGNDILSEILSEVDEYEFMMDVISDGSGDGVTDSGMKYKYNHLGTSATYSAGNQFLTNNLDHTDFYLRWKDGFEMHFDTQIPGNVDTIYVSKEVAPRKDIFAELLGE